jgi:hypothetical protein
MEQDKEQDKNANKKQMFLEYFKDVPIQSLAANYIGVCEDTITDWKKSDSDFSGCIDRLKAEYARRNLKDVKSTEWKLERVMNDHFGQKTKTDITSGGEKLEGGLSAEQAEQLIRARANRADTQRDSD